MSLASGYKCMFLVPRDQYEHLKNSTLSEAAAGVNTVDSGIGGDINDSNVQNIDVSEGGTLVINDGDRTPHISDVLAQRHPRKNKTAAELRPAGGHSIPIVVGATSPQTTTAQFHSQQPSSQSSPSTSAPPPQPSPAPSATSQNSTTSSQTQTAPNSPTSSKLGPKTAKKVSAAKKSVVVTPPISKKSSNILRNLVEDRVAELAGRKKEVKRRKTVSDSDLDRAVVHDIRDASRQVEAQPHPRNPPLSARRNARYRAQVAKIRPYLDTVHEEPVQAAAKPVPLGLPTRHVPVTRPHEMPLPPSDSEDSDLDDLGNQEYRHDSAARTRPRSVIYTNRVPKAVRRKDPMPGGTLDPFHYEPRYKIVNDRWAAVRKVGAVARKKRPVSKTEDQKRWERLNMPDKRVIRARPYDALSSGDEVLASDQEDGEQ